MKKKKFLVPIAVLSLTLCGTMGMTACKSCNEDEPPACEQHVDVNGDGVCDNCGTEILSVNLSLPANPEHGKITADKQFYSVGDRCILTIMPDTGYEVKSLKINGEEKSGSIVNKKLTFDVTGDINVEVAFELLEITLNLNELPAGCKVEFVKEGGYKYGEVVALKITAAESYSLVGFTVNGLDVLGDVEDNVYTVGEYAKNNGVITVNANFIKEVEASVLTVTAKDKAGAAVSLANAKLTIANSIGEYVLDFDAQGKLTGNVHTGEYTARLSLDGYSPKKITITETACSAEFLYELAHAGTMVPEGGMTDANDGKFILGGTNSGPVLGSGQQSPSKVMLNIGTENEQKDSVFVKFTVKMTQDIKDANSWRRFGIRLDDKSNGFGIRLGVAGNGNFLSDYIPEFIGVSNILTEDALESTINKGPEKALPNSDIRNAFGANIGDGHAGTAVTFAMAKAGDTFVFYYLNSDNEWVELNSFVAEESGKLAVMIMGSYCTWEFTDVAFSVHDGMVYIPYQAPTDSEYGKLSHFKAADGKLYNAAGEQITEADILIEKIAIVQNVKIKLTGLSGVTNKNLKILDAFGKEKEYSYNASTGIVEIPEIAEGNVSVEYTLNGKKFTFVVVGITATNKEKMLTAVAGAEEDVVTVAKPGDGNDVNNSWTKVALEELNANGAAINAKQYTFEVSVAVTGVIPDAGSWREHGISLSEAITIWQSWQYSSAGYKESGIWKNDGTTAASPDDHSGGAYENHRDAFLIHHDMGTIPEFMIAGEDVDGKGVITAIVNSDGKTTNYVRFRFVRDNDKITAYAFNPKAPEDGWIRLYQIECDADMTNEFALHAVYEGWTFFDITFSASTVRDGLEQTAANVTVSDDIQNGTVVANNSLFVGDNCRLNITPAEGYKLKSLTVGGENIELDRIVSGVYNFVVTQPEITVSAEFERIQIVFTVENKDELLNGCNVELNDEYFYGDEVVLKITAATDTKLVALTVNGQTVDISGLTGNTLSIGVQKTDALTVVATFVEESNFKAAVTITGGTITELENHKITLVNENGIQEATVVKDGAAYKISIPNAAAGMYKAYFDVDGYTVGEVVVGGNAATATIAITGNWAISTGTPNGVQGNQYGTAKVEIDETNHKLVLGGLGTAIYPEGSNEAQTYGYAAKATLSLGYDTLSKDSVLSFRLKLANDVDGAASWRKAGLVLNEKKEGFALFWNDGGNGYAHALGNGSMDGGNSEGKTLNPTVLDNALLGMVKGEGLELKVIKAGGLMQVLYKSGENYVLIYSVSIDADSRALYEFMGSYCDWEFSEISLATYDGLTYHEEVKATADTEGKAAHFTDKDGRFYNHYGVEVDESELVIPVLTVATNITIKVTGVTWTENDISITDYKGAEVEFTFANNSITIANVLEGDSKIVNNKDGIMQTLGISGSGKTYALSYVTTNVTGEFAVASGNNGDKVLSDSIASDAVKGKEHVIVETVIKVTERKSDTGAWGNAGIQISANNVITFVWNGDWSCLVYFTDGTINASSDGSGKVFGNMPAWLNNRTVLESDGFKVRFEIVGKSVTLWAFNPEAQEWAALGKVDFTEDFDLDLKLAARSYDAWSFTETKVIVVETSEESE